MIKIRISRGTKNNSAICALLFAISAIIIIYAPYQGDSPLGTAKLRNILKLVQYMIFGINSVIIFGALLRRRPFKISNIWAIFPVIILYLLSIFNIYDNNAASSGTLMSLLLILFAFAGEQIQLKTFKLFKNAWVIFSIIGIICYIAYIISLPIPYTIADYYFSLESKGVYMNYVSYGICFLYKQSSLIRLCGICNEPGYFGTIAALLLCASNLNMKERDNRIIFVAGLLTFSVAYILIILIYILLNCCRKPQILIGILILSLAYFKILPNIKTNNTALNDLISRLAITSSGLKGNNRSNNLLDEQLFLMFQQRFFLGFGNGYSASITTGVLTYKTYLINYGVIGFLMIYGTLLWSCLYKNLKRWDILFFVAVFFASIYQRPNVITLPYAILLYGGIQFIKKTSFDKKMSMRRVIDLC